MGKLAKNETYISLTGETLTLEDLKNITELKKLNTLWLQSCQIKEGSVLRKIKDDDLGLFRDLTKLETLSITNSDITDIGLLYLHKMKKLNTLNLNNSKIEGHGFRELVELDKLETIWLKGSLLSDENLKYFELFPKLTTILVQNSKVTHEGLYSLAKLTFLSMAEGGIFSKKHIKEFRKQQVKHIIGQAAVSTKLEPQILELISNFMQQITEIEKKLKQIDEEDVSESLRVEQLKNFNSVFDKFCDDRTERRYTEYGSHFQFFTYADFVPLALHQVSKSKIHAYYLDSSTVRFELVKKNEKWKLLRLQQQYNKRWRQVNL